MALNENDLLILLDETTSLSSVIGLEKQLVFKFKNLSLSDYVYNLSFVITAVDGIEIISTSLSESKIENFTDGTTKYYSSTIEDFAPNEDYYVFTINEKINERYITDAVVPFKSKQLLTIQVIADTSKDSINNTKIINRFNFELIAEKLRVNKIVPNKILKGCGDGLSDPTSIFDSEIQIINNTREPSIFSLKEILQDGFKYIGNVEAENINLTSPLITNESNNTVVAWDNLRIDVGVRASIKYQSSAYNNYSQDNIVNSGTLIQHGEELTLTSIVLGDHIDYTEHKHTKALDYLLELKQNTNMVDVDSIININGSIKVSEYVNLNNCSFRAIVPDGYILDNSENWITNGLDDSYNEVFINNLSNLNALDLKNLNFKIQVLEKYKSNLQYVYSGDPFYISCTIDGYLQENDLKIEDNVLLNQKVILPKIDKTVISIIDRLSVDKTGKPITTLDKIKYRLEFDNTFIKAKQKNAIIDDFFPENITLPNVSDIVTILGNELIPDSIVNSKLVWTLGDVLEPTNWIVEYSCTMSSNTPEKYLYTLARYTGTNSYGITHSGRKLVKTLIGHPNIKLNHTIKDIDKNSIEANQEIDITLTINNTQNSENGILEAHYFNITETLPAGLSFIDNSFIVIGTTNKPIITSNNVYLLIDELATNQSVSMSYKCKVVDNLSPNIRFNINSSTTRSYTQKFIEYEENVQYDIPIVTVKDYLKSKPILFNCTASNNKLNKIFYNIHAIIPKGTSANNLRLENVLIGEQTPDKYGTFNSEKVMLTITNNNVNFPVFEVAKADTSDLELTYLFNAFTNFSDEIETFNVNSILKYIDMFGNQVVLNGNSIINLLDSLLKLKISSDNNFINAVGQLSIGIQVDNNSTEDVEDIVVKLPLSNIFYYRDATSNTGGLFKESNNIIRWNIPALKFGESVDANIYVVPNKIFSVSDTINVKAEINKYTTYPNFENYGKISSNILPFKFLSNATLGIQKRHLVNNKGFVLVGKYKFKTVQYTIKNLSVAKDDFILSLSQTEYPIYVYFNGNYIDKLDIGESKDFVSTLINQVESYKTVTVQLVTKATDDANYGDINKVTMTLKSSRDNSLLKEFVTDFVDP